MLLVGSIYLFDVVLGLSETIDHMAMANSVCWYGRVLRREDGHVLRREDGHVLRRPLDFKVDDQRKKLKLKKTWKKQVEEESLKVGWRRKDIP